MRSFTFRGTTVQEAIRLAKAELGPDALIVEVRRAPRDNYVEISAIPADAAEETETYDQPRFPRIDALAGRHRQRERAERAANRPTEPRFDAASRTGKLVPPDEEIYFDPTDQDIATLRGLGIDEPLASRLAAACGVGSSFGRHAATAELLRRAIPTRDLVGLEDERVIAALVGPTGVGKTTTIAKLAAVFSAGRGWKVALLTTDTYRVGAIAQLKTFAEILRLPFHTIYTREDLDSALRATADANVVLIDTPGCNPYDAAMLKEMRNLLVAGTPVCSYLTLAMTGDFEEMLSAVQRFALLHPAGMIATKLDETRRAAALVGLAQEARLPLTYACAGPLVPDDISLATHDLLADLLLDALEQRHRRELVRT